MYGRLFTASSGNRLFLPAAGYRYGIDRYYAGSNGYFWSSEPYPSSSNLAYYLGFYSMGASWYGYRFSGFSVRPVAE